MSSSHSILLICTVGGTPEPIVKSLVHWAPERVLFIPSHNTRPQIEEVLARYAKDAGRPLAPGCYRICPVEEAEDLAGCLRTIRDLSSEIAQWVGRGEGYGIVADFTGGTKCMSAALALQARRWRCQFSYVGGTRRMKDGVGVVESGFEYVLHSANPWDALGYQTMEEAVAVFNQGGFASAAHLLDRAIQNAERPEVKRELATLKAVIDAYAAWDRFDHGCAAECFKDALKNQNDLHAIFPGAQPLIARLEHHSRRVADLSGMGGRPSISWIEDLLRNAWRRAKEGRFDDAVARLYRACEALAQIRLRERHDVPDTKTIPLDKLPVPLRAEWEPRARDGAVSVGLQDAYRLLHELGDELGGWFSEAGLAGERSPFSARNRSILGHGFEPIGKATYSSLHKKLLSWAELKDLPDDPWELPKI